MPAQKIDSHYYWDGGLWSNTPLREVLNCLQPLNVSQQQGGREYEIQYEIPHYQIYLINDHPHQGPLPKDVLGVQERLLDIIMADKTGYDKKVSEQLNHYIELIQKLHQHSQDFPAEVRKQIDEEYQEISQKKRAILHIVSLQRTGLPGDRWSATGDFSHSRIEELIAQGEQETQQQLL
jgi:predicted acylesterase/phospholipase RssA